MFDGLASILRSSKEDGVRASWGAHGELVNGKTLTVRLDDARTGSTSETEGGNAHLRDFEETKNDS